MQAILRRGEALAVPPSPRELILSPIAAHWRRIGKRFEKLAGQPQSTPRELPPEWFRYPFP
jgi:hypothetical protein